MADAMAARGGIGIADRMLAKHYPNGGPAAPSGPISERPERVERDRQTSLSASLVQQIERRIVRSLEDEPTATASAGKTG
jgi:Rod binding domain-containing protein